MNQSHARPRFVLGTIAAIVGGILGYVAFFWIARQGFYALIVPPGLLGLAAGYCVGKRSIPFAIACGIAGLAIGLVTEWQFTLRNADKGFLVFLTRVPNLNVVKLVMLALGPIISYRLALGPDHDRKSTSSDSTDRF